MLQCRISHVPCSCGTAPAAGFKPNYGAFVFQGQEWGLAEALAVLRAQREFKYHLNVVSTISPTLNLCLNRVQGLCCSCGTREKTHPNGNRPQMAQLVSLSFLTRGLWNCPYLMHFSLISQHPCLPYIWPAGAPVLAGIRKYFNPFILMQPEE